MLFKKNIEQKILFQLSLAAFILAIIVVVLGAFTRLVDAGLGCPDWPGCYGHLLWPNEADEIVRAEAKFPDAPVENDKTWPEMVHRYFAGTLGLLILSMCVIAVKASASSTKAASQVPVKHTVGLLCLVILQAAFGMWTVTLKLWPQVVTAHLLGGFATLSLLWLLIKRLGASKWLLSPKYMQQVHHLKPLLLFSLLAVVIQIALGGWVSSNYAALACPDLPQCLGQWLPPTDFKAGFNLWQEIGPNYLGGQLDNHARTAIHLTHRVGAFIVTITLLVLAIRLWQIKSANIHRWALLLYGVLLLQLTLGVSNILFVLPLSVAVAHNAVGAMLLLVVISLVYHTYTAQHYRAASGNYS